MELFRVSVESHRCAATVYVAGQLNEHAAEALDEVVRDVLPSARVMRVDLRGVVSIDPCAFANVVRSLSRWRDERHAQVIIQFPERSPRGPARHRYRITATLAST